MTQATAFLNHIDAAGLGAIGLLALIDWLRHRGAKRAWLAAALGLLGLVSILGQFTALHPLPWFLTVLNLVLFMASGYALFEFRHQLIPLKQRTRTAVIAVLVATTIAATPLTLAGSAQSLPPFAWFVLSALILEWCACIGEPAVRFLIASRHLPVVQRKRLRALSTGYLVIAIVLVLALGAALGSASVRGRPSPVMTLVLQIASTFLIPCLYAGFAPPRWLRASWRASEADAFRRGNELLMTYAEDASVIAGRAVEWAARFVGASGALMVLRTGEVLGRLGLGDADARKLADRASVLAATGQGFAEGLLIVPIPASESPGMLVVSAGPFSPVFGSDEMLMLRRYADSLAVAMDRVHLSSSLRRQSQRMESLLRAVSDLGAGLVVIEEGRLTDVNDAYRTITGFAGDELNGRSLRELIHEDDRESLDDHLRDDRSAMGPVRFEVRLFRKDGSTVEAETVLDSFDGESGGTRIALVQDISARKHAERTLADAARLDPLTGLANRRSWQEFIASSLEQAATSMQPLCVALIDLDNFKDYNDDWGHQRGDRLLAEVAEAWKAALREGDFVARYGGDEFAIAMPGCKLDQAESVLQRLLGASPQAASIGLAEWDGAENAEDLVSRADGALLSCKRDRRGAITVVHGTPTGDRFVNWSARLDTVLNGTDLTSAYQPIVELESGDLLGYEALLRVSGSPADSSVEALFSTAQRLGYSRALDWLGRRMAMECAATLPPDALLFVNASARALLDPVHASDQMLMLLRWTQRDAQSVVLELSEREVITDLPRLNEVLAEYRSHGFRFALDDVGEGHSTLEVLAASNPEFIKIAHSLTRSVLERGPRAAVRAIVTFADSTGAIVIAEGVADARSAENMGELGVRFGQGYGLGRPRYFPRHAAEQPALNSA